MRNLKKVLSLALAMVMLLGMMVVGAGAATSFKDDSDIPDERLVAAAVSNTAGVLIGDAEGNFNPKDTLTRAEAAVILARLDLGADAAKALTATNAATFDDIGNGSGYGWAKAYIDYCYGNGYMIGVGDNRFAPGKTLTSVEFGLMISRVLGYRDANEDITGSDWAVKAAALARKAGLGTDVPVNDQDMTRADMAQMVLNALQAPMVEYTGLNISSDILTINSPATVRTHTNNSAGNRYTYNGEEIKPNITPIRLCEEKFPDLRLKRDSLDAFGREYSQWTWKYVGITGSESEVNADAVYTKGTGATTVKADINDARGYADTAVYINGKGFDGSSMNSTRIAKLTANGREVQVYLNKDNHKLIEKVVVVDTYAAKINSISKDNTDDRYVTVVTQDTKQTGPETPTTGLDKDNNVVNTALSKLDKTFKTQDFAAGDVVSYSAAWNDDNKAYEIQEMTKLEISATATLEKWVGKGLITSSDKGLSDSNFTAGGQKYDYSVNNAIVTEYGEYATNRIASFTAGKSEINIYLDEYGYALYVSGVEAVKNYATVIGVGRSNQYGSETRGVTLLLPDGTTKEVIAKMDVDVWNKMSSKNVDTGALTKGFDKNNTTENLYVDGVGDVVSYSVGANDIYTLVPANSPTNYYHTYTDLAGYKASFVSGKSLIGIGNTTEGAANSLYTTSKTIFMIGSPNSKGTSYNYSAYVGYASAPSIKWDKVSGVSYVTNSYYKNQIDAIYIDVEGVEAPTNYIYFVKAASNSVTTTDFGSYSLSAVVDDEITTIEIKTALTKAWVDGKAATSLEDAPAGLYVIDKVVKDANGIITDCDVIELADAFKFTSGAMTGTIQRNGNVLGFGYASETTARYGAYTDSTKVYRIDEDYSEITAWNVESVPTDLNDVAYAQHNGASDPNERKLTNVFVKEVEGNVKPVQKFEVTITGVSGAKISVTDKDGKIVESGAEFEKDYVLNVKAELDPASETKEVALLVDGKEYKSTTLTLTKDVTISAKVTDKTAAPEADIDAQFTDVKIVAKDSTGKVYEGFTVTAANVMDATEAAKAPYSSLSSIAAGDVYLAFDIPDNVTITNGSVTVDVVAGGYTYPATATAQGTGATGKWAGYIDISSTAIAELTAGKDTTLTINVPVAATTTPVKFSFTEETYGLNYAGTNTTKAMDVGTDDIAVKVTGLDKDVVGEATVEYSITGVKNGPVTGTADSATYSDSDGTITVTALLGSSKKTTLELAEGASEIAVALTVKATEYKGKIALDDSVKSLFTDGAGAFTTANVIDGTGTTPVKAESVNPVDLNDSNGVAAFHFKSDNIKGAVVKYKLENASIVTDEKITVEGTAKIDSSGYLKLCDSSKTDGSLASTAKVYADGKGLVTLTITEVVELTFDGSAFKAIAGDAACTTVTSGTIITVAAKTDSAGSESTTKINFTLTQDASGKWVNKEALILNFTPGQNGTASETIDLSFLNVTYTGSAITTSGQAADQSPVFADVGAGKLELTSFNTILVQFDKHS